MFGRRSGGPVPKATRIIVGVIAALVGALSLWVGVQASIGQITDAQGPPWLAIVFGAMMAGLGLMLVVGAFAGVGDSGERPASMWLATRLFIDAMGYLFGFGFAAMMGFAAIQSARDGVIFGAIGFGFFALVMGGLSTYALVRALIRAVRGAPYDDGAPVERQ
jgi:hypothetical protein